MSKYPSIEEYSNALQAARNTISDPKLAQGTVQTNNWGIPLARNGTFALTYKITAGGQDYAFRCFQRDRPGMHQRYTAISAALRKNSLPYFVTFDYLDDGITILTKPYPALVMQWAEGQPLSAYIEENKTRPTKLKALRSQIEALGQSLEAAGIAHGDIQTNNIVVADDGELRLVDYDGMYVPALKSKGALEAGHKNFQHPERERLSPYDATLDRFSFAVLYVGISALIEKPSYWSKLSGDPEALLLRATDFADPDNSEAFTLLTALPGAGEAAQRLMAISKAPYAEVPSFSDFLAGRNMPTKERTITSKPKATRPGASKSGGEVPWYHEAAGTGSSQTPASQPRYRVLDASDLGACLGAAGQDVELIGQIKKVTLGESGAGLPFAHLRLAMDIESSPEVLIWFQGMRALDYIGQQPNESWKGQWVSASGFMTSRGDATTVTHPAIVIETANQFELITPGQAKFRLKGGMGETPAEAAPQTNAEKLAGLGEAGKQAKVAQTASTGATGTSGGGTGTASNTASGNRDWWPVALLLGVLVLVAIVFILASKPKSGASGESEYVDSGTTVAAPAAATTSYASDQVGTCWNGQFVEVSCTSTDLEYKATTWMTTSYGCLGEALPWEDGNYLCLTSVEPPLNPKDFETCFTDESNSRTCNQGLTWTYSYCWNRGGAILEQKIAGEWNTIMSDVAIMDPNYCDTEFPYVVEFALQEDGPGTQYYNLFFPQTSDSPSESESIKVTVTKQ